MSFTLKPYEYVEYTVLNLDEILEDYSTTGKQVGSALRPPSFSGSEPHHNNMHGY